MPYALTLSGSMVHRVGPVEGRTVCGVQIHVVHEQPPAGQQCGPCNAPTGACPSCGYETRLRSGVLPQHKQHLVGQGGVVFPGAKMCEGSGEEPERGAAVAVVDQRADRLSEIACELVARIRDEDPDAVNRWLSYAVPPGLHGEPDDRWGLLFVLAAAVPTDRPWRYLTAWTMQGRPQIPPQPVDDADRSAA